MKILYLTYGPQSNVIRYLSQALLKKGFTVEQFNAADGLSYRHKKWRIPSFKPTNMLNSILAMVQFVGNWKVYFYRTLFAFRLMTRNCELKLKKSWIDYDLVFQSGVIFAPSFKPLPIPHVLYIDHTYAITKRYKAIKGLRKPLRVSSRWERMEKQVYSNASLILTMSSFVKDSLIVDYGIEPHKIAVVGAGPNVEIQPGPWHKRFDTRTVLFVGKDFRRKGGDVLLKAFELVKEEIKDAKLVIAGESRESKEGDVLFKGLVEPAQIGQLYSQASCFVLPSFWEPFGISFLEAMAYKLPCVGTDTEAMPEIIKKGETGLLVSVGDAYKLAESIISVLRDESVARQMGEAGYRRIQTYFNWDGVGDRVIEAIRAKDLLVEALPETEGIRKRCSFAIRDDDVCYFTQPEDLEAAFSKVWDRMPISFSVVPFHACTKSGSIPKEFWHGEKAFPIGDNLRLVNYLKQKIREGKITISLHGYDHKEQDGKYEFQAKEGLYQKISEGKKYLEDLLETKIKTFVPPQNTISKEGLEAVRKMGLSLTCVPSFMPGQRALRLKDFISFIKLKMHIFRYGRVYPRVLNLGDHKELYCHQLKSVEDFERLRYEFDFCYNSSGQFCLNTHYWQLKDNPLIVESLVRFLRYVSRFEGLELTDLDNLFSAESMRFETRYRRVGYTPIMKILYLTYGPQSFVIEHLSRDLAKERVQVDVFNAAKKVRYRHPIFRIPSMRWENLLNAILAMVQFGKNWKIYFFRTTFAFKLMTRYCQRKLNKDGSNYDLILQSGVLFAPSRRTPPNPYALYIDHTYAITKMYPDVVGLPHPVRVTPAWEAMEREVYQNAACIFTMSNNVKQSLIEDYCIEGGKVSVVGAGPNVKIPHPNWSNPHKDKTVLFVGKDFNAKGGPTLLQAFDIVRRQIREARLIVVGEKYPDIRKEDVDFRGYVRPEDMAEVYREATIFVLPTVREAFGIAFLEAMAHKLPCIGSRIEAIPEIIDDGKTGFLVPVGDYVKLAERIICLLNDKDLMSRMGEEGYKKVREFYNWDGATKRILEGLKRVRC